MPAKQGDDIVCVDRASFAMRDGLTYFEAAFCDDVDAGREEGSILAFRIDCANDWSKGGEVTLGPLGKPPHTIPVAPDENGAALAKQVCAAAAG